MRSALLVAAMIVLLPATALAEDTIELSNTQRGYNEQGVEAIGTGDFAAAIRKFQSSLTLGEANITYLNLGRAYQRNGDCKLAKETYAKVATSPAVPAPTRDEILQVLQKYQAELPAQCPVKLTVVCDDPATQVSLDGSESAGCSDGLAYETTAGDHVVTANLGPQDYRKEFTAGEGDAVEIAVALTPTQEPADVSVVAPPEPPRQRGGRLASIGVSTAIAGAGILASALLVDLLVVRPQVLACNNPERLGENPPECNVDSAHTAQGIGAGLYIVGGLVVGTGVTLIILGQKKEKRVDLRWNGGPGLAFSTSF